MTTLQVMELIARHCARTKSQMFCRINRIPYWRHRALTSSGLAGPNPEEGVVTFVEFQRIGGKWWVAFQHNQNGERENQRVSPEWFARNILGLLPYKQKGAVCSLKPA